MLGESAYLVARRVAGRSRLALVLSSTALLLSAASVVGALAAPTQNKPRFPWGQWRGTVVLEAVEKGEVPPIQDGFGGWAYDRTWRITWNLNGRSGDRDAYVIARAAAKVDYARNDVGIPREGYCDDAVRASASYSRTLSEPVVEMSRRTGGYELQFTSRRFSAPRIGVRHEYGCGEPQVFEEQFRIPQTVFLKSPPIQTTRTRIRGTWVSAVRCPPRGNAPGPRFQCVEPERGSYITTFTVMVDLRKIASR
jgi:hypothetical protein